MALKQFVKTSFPAAFSLLSKTKHLVLSKLVSQQKASLSRRLSDYFKDTKSDEIRKVVSYLTMHAPRMIPYAFAENYDKVAIEVLIDENADLYYTIVSGNRIYFPKEMTLVYIQEAVRNALMEQDFRSPHKYLPVDGHPINGDVAVVCGASDGIYTLEIINSFRKIYLFEANPAWVRPIKATLRNYLDKIEIVPLFISDQDGPNRTTLDTFFSGKNDKVNYLQADIEGDELKMLNGARELLKNTSHMAMSLCCYHTPSQETELREFLLKEGFNVSPSNGYLLLWMQYPLRPPYLRRGVLYASR